jgi:hypothetical protein
MTDSDRFEEPPPSLEPPLDQFPVDQQPLPPRLGGGENSDLSSGPRLLGIPQLPPDNRDGPAMPSRPTGPPLIPPLETTSPVDFVDAAAHPVAADSPVAMSATSQMSHDRSDFAPLRSDPPPALVPTWWLRSAVLLSLFVAIGVTLWTEYQGAPGDVATSTAVWGAHLLAGALLVLWSFLAMGNAGRIVPVSRYQKRSSGLVAGVLWLLAAIAPFGTVAMARLLEDRLSDSEDLAAVAIMVAVVFVAFVLLWLPFRYHSRQASRVGAPHRAMLGWFFAPLLAGVGGLLMLSLGLGDLLADEGLAPSERLLQVGVAYAVPMFVFALSTWRAITVFDEVIDLRWHRWRTEWEHTLGDLAAQPAPGPEGSPDIDNLLDS